MQSVNRLRPGIEISLQADLSRMIAEKQKQISEIAKHQANISSWLRNVERGQTIADQAENTISGIANQLVRTKELLVQASNETQSPESRELIAIEVEAIGQSIDVNDGFGNRVFAVGTPLQIPIDEQVEIVVAPSRAALINSGVLTNEIANAIRIGDPNAMLTVLDDEITRITDLLGSQGIIGNQLDQSTDFLENRKLDLAAYRSSLEDTDISQSIASMQKLLVNLQAA